MPWFWFLMIAGMIALGNASAQIAAFDFEGETLAPVFHDPLVTVSSFSASSGTVSFPGGNDPSPLDSVSAGGWNGAEGAKWWEFVVTPSDGSLLNLSSFQFDDQRSSTGPASWSLTINGIPAASGQLAHSAFDANPMNTISLSDAAFQSLSSATVALYGYDAPGASGTWRIDNIALHGSVSPVPEPRQFGLILGGGLLLYAACRGAVGRR